MREWGYVNDKAKNARHVYSSKAPGVSFFGVPVLFAETELRKLLGWPAPGKREATFWLRLWAVKLPMLAFFWLFARYVERKTRSGLARDLLLIALGLGTMLYPYGGMFVGHALAAAAAFAAFISWMICASIAGAARGAGDRRGPSDPAARRGGRVSGGAGGDARVPGDPGRAGARRLSDRPESPRDPRRSPPARWPRPSRSAPTIRRCSAGPGRSPTRTSRIRVFAQTAHKAGFDGLTLPHLEAFPAFLISPAYGLFAFSPVLILGSRGGDLSPVRGARGARRC